MGSMAEPLYEHKHQIFHAKTHNQHIEQIMQIKHIMHFIYINQGVKRKQQKP